MAEEIVVKVLLTLVGFVTTGVLGYLTAKVKEHKKRDTQQQLALMCLLRSTITSKYYVYSEMGEIPHYEKENIDKLHEQYKNMGGNSYVDIIVDDLNKLPVTK